MDPRIAGIEKEQLRTDLPSFAPGDTVRVRVRIREGDKERVQPFEGVCIARRGAGLNATFTLRRISGGVGVERIFPLHSPWIAGLEVVRRGDVRRAKLYYLRARRGKRARVRERKWWLDQKLAAEAGVTPPPEDLPEAAAGMAAGMAVGDAGEEGGPVGEEAPGTVGGGAADDVVGEDAAAPDLAGDLDTSDLAETDGEEDRTTAEAATE